MDLRGESKKCKLWGYVGKKTVDSKHDEVKVIVIGEASSRKSVPQIIGSWDEAVQKKPASYEANVDGSTQCT